MFLRSILLVVGATAVAEGFAVAPGFTGANNKLGLSSPSARFVTTARESGRAGLTSLSMAEQRRVVVTGMGITSCLGNTLEDVTDSLYNAK